MTIYHMYIMYMCIYIYIDMIFTIHVLLTSEHSVYGITVKYMHETDSETTSECSFFGVFILRHAEPLSKA